MNMRKIKFRGKSAIYKDWVYGNLVYSEIDDEYCIIRSDEVEIDGHHIKQTSERPVFTYGKTIGQFTGVYDINGKEIYENDIVDTYPFERGYGVFTVSFASGYEEDLGMSQGWYLQQGNFERYIPLRTSNEETEKVEVIGNIFDNPNLVEQ